MIVNAKSIQELLSESDKASHDRSPGCTPNLYALDMEHGILDFVTVCMTSRNGWGQRIQFLEWQIEPPAEDELPVGADADAQWRAIRGRNPALNQTDVKVECDCPAFIWWGHHFNLDQEQSTFYSQPFPPDKNDPARLRHSCKHLLAVYHYLFI